MYDADKAEILKAIGELKTEVAVLKTKEEGIEKYIYKELKPDIESLCTKIEIRFKWMMVALITFMSLNIGIAAVIRI